VNIAEPMHLKAISEELVFLFSLSTIYFCTLCHAFSFFHAVH